MCHSFSRGLEPVAGLGVPALDNGYLPMDEHLGGPVFRLAKQARSLTSLAVTPGDKRYRAPPGGTEPDGLPAAEVPGGRWQNSR